MNNITPIVKNILIINVILFVATHFVFPQFWEPLALHFWRADGFKPWQIVSHIFMHGGFTHILFNMFGLYIFGPHLERIWGPKRFLNYYMICGLGAALCQMLIYEYEFTQGVLGPFGNNVLMVGASGAIMGLLLGFAWKFPNVELMIIFLPIPIKAKYFVFIYAAYDLFAGAADVSGMTNSSIAHFAHLGGMLFGLIILLIWRKNDNDNFYQRWD